jgi:hypothetical protein
MDHPTAFKTFLQDIRPTPPQREDFKKGHTVLRDRLLADESLKDVIVTTFLQGSYRRATAIRLHHKVRSDVDLVVVTNLDRDQVSPDAALNRFVPFMKKHYLGKWGRNERSLGIELSYVDLDLVVTSSPPEVELVRREAEAGMLDEDEFPTAGEAVAWKTEALWIPNRQADRWEPTHPLRQLAETRAKNARCNGHYVNVVKAIKWWKRQDDSMPKHPRSYPLERLIYEYCPDGIKSVAEGITRTFETLLAYCGNGIVPFLDNPGVSPAQNVMARVPADDFRAFIERGRAAARLARRALDSDDEATSVDLWRELLGSQFPKSPGGGSGSKPGGFSPRTEVSDPPGGRFG